MADGVLLDTSFLITLADKNRQNHDVARRYWRHFLDNDIPIYLSTIVVSEFSVRQVISANILQCCVILPFNWDNAQRTASIYRVLSCERQADESRVAVKYDFKLIAQADGSGAEFIITADSKTLCRFCESLLKAGEVKFTAIRLEDGYDSAHFDPQRQKDFLDALDGSGEGEEGA